MIEEHVGDLVVGCSLLATGLLGTAFLIWWGGMEYRRFVAFRIDQNEEIESSNDTQDEKHQKLAELSAVAPDGATIFFTSIFLCFASFLTVLAFTPMTHYRVTGTVEDVSTTLFASEDHDSRAEVSISGVNGRFVIPFDSRNGSGIQKNADVELSCEQAVRKGTYFCDVVSK